MNAGGDLRDHAYRLAEGPSPQARSLTIPISQP
jgi:hypothetical protein